MVGTRSELHSFYPFHFLLISIKTFISHVINLLLNKLARDCTGRRLIGPQSFFVGTSLHSVHTVEADIPAVWPYCAFLKMDVTCIVFIL